MDSKEVLVDAHVHVASGDETTYPRRPSGLGSTWWHGDVGVEHLRGTMDACGVDRAVVVQAVGVYGYDCRYAADATAGSDRLALVGAIDMAGSDPDGDFELLSRTTALTGLRLFGVGASGVQWLADRTGASVWERAAQESCVLVPTIFPDALGLLRGVMERQPGVDVALDHSAFVGPSDPAATADLLAMAELPRLHVKVTSHNLDTDGDPAAILEPLVAAFGPHRVCWGSDHPQHQTRSYAELLEIAHDAARNLTSDERAAFLGENSLRLWWPTSNTRPAHHRGGAQGATDTTDDRLGSPNAR